MTEKLTDKEYEDMRWRLLDKVESARFTTEWYRRHPEYGKLQASLDKHRKRASIEIDFEDLFLIDSIKIGEREVKVI